MPELIDALVISGVTIGLFVLVGLLVKLIGMMVFDDENKRSQRDEIEDKND